jgi:hypothetical protein
MEPQHFWVEAKMGLLQPWRWCCTRGSKAAAEEEMEYLKKSRPEREYRVVRCACDKCSGK